MARSIDRTARTVGVADVEEFVLERAGKLGGVGGLQDAVANAGNQQSASLLGTGPFFNDDPQQWERAIGGDVSDHLKT